jgi:hypothetical protein
MTRYAIRRRNRLEMTHMPEGCTEAEARRRTTEDAAAAVETLRWDSREGRWERILLVDPEQARAERDRLRRFVAWVATLDQPDPEPGEEGARLSLDRDRLAEIARHELRMVDRG